MVVLDIERCGHAQDALAGHGVLTRPDLNHAVLFALVLAVPVLILSERTRHVSGDRHRAVV